MILSQFQSIAISSQKILFIYQRRHTVKPLNDFLNRIIIYILQNVKLKNWDICDSFVEALMKQFSLRNFTWASRILIESWKWKRHHHCLTSFNNDDYNISRCRKRCIFPIETFASTQCAGSISVLRVEQFSSQRKPTEVGDKCQGARIRSGERSIEPRSRDFLKKKDQDHPASSIGISLSWPSVAHAL